MTPKTLAGTSLTSTSDYITMYFKGTTLQNMYTVGNTVNSNTVGVVFETGSLLESDSVAITFMNGYSNFIALIY